MMRISMIEHEVKVLETDVNVVMKQIENLGGTLLYEVHIRDRYYDTPDGSLNTHNQRLRIRKQNEDIIITKKTKYENNYTKSMREDDVIVYNFEYAKKLLEKKLGLVQVKYKEKKRITYKWNNVLFDFDYYEGLPPVMEIEGESPEHVMKVVRRLGLQFHTQVKWGSKRLFQHYGKEHL